MDSKEYSGPASRCRTTAWGRRGGGKRSSHSRKQGPGEPQLHSGTRFVGIGDPTRTDSSCSFREGSNEAVSRFSVAGKCLPAGRADARVEAANYFLASHQSGYAGTVAEQSAGLTAPRRHERSGAAIYQRVFGRAQRGGSQSPQHSR